MGRRTKEHKRATVRPTGDDAADRQAREHKEVINSAKNEIVDLEGRLDDLKARIASLEAKLPHDLGGDEHSEDTLANLNSKVSDATLDDEGDRRPHDGTQITIDDSLSQPDPFITHGSARNADPRALIWEGNTDHNGMYVRVYYSNEFGGSTTGSWEVTINAKWNGTSWEKDYSKLYSSKLALSRSDLYFYRQDTETGGWADSSWTTEEPIIDNATLQ